MKLGIGFTVLRSIRQVMGQVSERGNVKHTAYEELTKQQLIEKLVETEKRINHSCTCTHLPSLSKPQVLSSTVIPRSIDARKYATRYVALKLAYIGSAFNGYEHSDGTLTRLPSVEEEIWKALALTRLIFPRTNELASSLDYVDLDALSISPLQRCAKLYWTGCNYSKCGRTDKGVSSFGQVIALNLRSNRPIDSSQESTFDPVNDEICYPQVLNRVLPPEIRILAWCPYLPDSFSARFSCRERRYKYFFTQPALLPDISSPHQSPLPNEAWLNIELMRTAAQDFIGVHDFRNFCKIDPARQLTNFTRQIFHIDINPVCQLDLPTFLHTSNIPAQPCVYAISIHGSAFLYHQVRHMVAILFLIGQGLESPQLVSDLLDIKRVPRRPNYEMAADTPLVLWDCIFPGFPNEAQTDSPYSPPWHDVSHTNTDTLQWVYTNDISDQIIRENVQQHHITTKRNNSSCSSELIVPTCGRSHSLTSWAGLLQNLWSNWRKSKLEEILNGMLLDIVANKFSNHIYNESNMKNVNSQKAKTDYSPHAIGAMKASVVNSSNTMPQSLPLPHSEWNNLGTRCTTGKIRIFNGGEKPWSKKGLSKYVPILQRDLLDDVEVVNARWAKKYEGKKMNKMRNKP